MKEEKDNVHVLVGYPVGDRVGNPVVGYPVGNPVVGYPVGYPVGDAVGRRVGATYSSRQTVQPWRVRE